MSMRENIEPNAVPSLRFSSQGQLCSNFQFDSGIIESSCTFLEGCHVIIYRRSQSHTWHLTRGVRPEDARLCEIGKGHHDADE